MEITDLLGVILAEVGMPAGAIALAIGLVRGAGVLEKDASAPARKYVSSLLAGKGLTNFAGIGLRA